MNKKYWYVLISGCMMMATNIGVCLNAYTIFYEPICESLGVLRGDLAIHATISNILCAVIGLIVPRFLNDKSYKKIIILGTACTGGSLIIMSQAKTLMQFYLLGALRGFGLGLFGVVVCSILINNWFVKRHGTMVSIMMSFSGIAGAILSPVLAKIIVGTSYSFAYIVAGIIIIGVNLPAILLPYSFTPESEGMVPYGYEGEQIAQKADNSKVVVKYLSPIILLMVIYAIGSTLVSNFVQFIPSYAGSMGLNTEQGAVIVSAVMVGNILSKLAIGAVSDKFGAKNAVCIFIGVNIVALVILMFSHSASLQIVGGFLYGSIFATSSVGNVLVVKTGFPGREYNKAYSFVNFVANIVGAFGLMFMGYLYDFTNTYFYHYVLWIVVGIINILLITFITRKKTN